MSVIYLSFIYLYLSSIYFKDHKFKWICPILIIHRFILAILLFLYVSPSLVAPPKNENPTFIIYNVYLFK